MAYARHGLAVFPLKARDKVPATVHGVKDATRDEAVITQWWSQEPEANIGIAAGQPSGVVVFDVDGEAGEQSLVSLMEEHGALPMTPAVATGKGFHLYFRMPEEALANRVAMAAGLDLRSTGGYVVAPPSIHPSGRAYEWQVDYLYPFAAFPKWLADLAHKEQVAREIHTDVIPEGQRNDTAFRDASAMRRRGMDAEAIYAAIKADKRYSPPLPDHEIWMVARDVARTYPAGDPEGDANEAWKERQKAKREEAEAEVEETLYKLASEIQPEETLWLWHPYIPRGMVVILDGDPGLGKSTLMLDIVARLTRGDLMPLSALAVEEAGAVVVTVEDDLARTVVKRLRAQGADLTRVALIDEFRDTAVMIPDHLPRLEKAINKMQAKILVIDPVMAVLDPDVDSHRDQEVRAKIMRPLKELAQRTDCTICLVRHLNKVSGNSAMYRGGGSIGIVGAVRSAMIVAKDPTDPEARVFAQYKSSLARSGESIRYHIEDTGDVGRLVFDGASDLTADQLVLQDLREAPKTAEAAKFLRDMLANGPMTRADLDTAAKNEGIKANTMEEAAKMLGVVKRKDGIGTGSGWVWSLRGFAEMEEI